MSTTTEPRRDSPEASGGLRAYARHRKALGLTGGSHAAVKKAIDQGRITAFRLEEGRHVLDFAACDEQWRANTAEKHQPRRKPGNPAPAAATAPPPPANGTNGHARALSLQEGLPDRNTLERLKLYHQTNKAELEAREKAGELLPVAEVESAVTTYFRELRDVLLALPGAVANELAAEPDAAKIRQRLEQEIHSVLDKPAVDLDGLRDAA